MPKALPPHALRERWMATIAASFHQLTIFRFTRRRALEVNSLLEDLESEVLRFKEISIDYWSGPCLLRFWHIVRQILAIIGASYLEILKRLSESEWAWWRLKDEAHHIQLRARKESMIKLLAVHDWVFILLQSAIASSFSTNRPWFLDQRQRLPGREVPQRRSSWQDDRSAGNDRTSDKAIANIAILRWTRGLEKRLTSSLYDLQDQYNQGKVLEHYVCQVQRQNEQEKSDWGRDNIPWPYPDYSLKVIGLDTPGSKSFQRHWPVHGVPSWQEDEELQDFLI